MLQEISPLLDQTGRHRRSFSRNSRSVPGDEEAAAPASARTVDPSGSRQSIGVFNNVLFEVTDDPELGLNRVYCAQSSYSPEAHTA